MNGRTMWTGALRRVRGGVTLAAMALVLVGPGALEGQQTPPPQRQQMERQLRARMQQMVQQRLGLNDAEMALVQEVIDSAQVQRRQIALREREVQRRIRGAGTLDDAATTEIVEELLSIRDEEIRLQTAELERLRELLTDRQLLELLVVRDEIGRRLQQLRGRGGRGGEPAAGGPFGRGGTSPMGPAF